MMEYSVGSTVGVPGSGAVVQRGMTGVRLRVWGEVIFWPEVFKEPGAGVFDADEEDAVEGTYPVKNA